MSFLCVLLVRKVATNLKKTIIAKSEKKFKHFSAQLFFYCENQFAFANFTFKVAKKKTPSLKILFSLLRQMSIL